MNYSKKMLVLGSDYFTLSVVQEAKKIGIYVIVTDLMESSPTKKCADESWMISTDDIDALEKKCIKENVNAIMFGASDFNVNNARKLCKRLGLPIYCENDYAWEISKNKFEFKKICKKVGVPVARDFYITDALTESELGNIVYPVVVKPVDLSGNRGISFCDNRKELIKGYKYARNISQNKNIVIERKLTGTEHHVCYAAGNGEIRLISFAEANHASDQLSNIYSFERSTSRFLNQYLNEVNDNLIAAFKEIGCREGIVWADTMRDENDGKFYVLEMGYRFAAAMASCALYEKVSDFNVVKWMIECALGIKHNKNNMPKPLNHAYKGILGLAHMFTKKEGIIGSIEGLDEISNMENVFIDMPKRENAKVRANTCIALISIYGEDCKEMLDKLKIINSKFKIFDKEGNDMIIYYDDYKTIMDNYQQGLSEFC